MSESPPAEIGSEGRNVQQLLAGRAYAWLEKVMKVCRLASRKNSVSKCVSLEFNTHIYRKPVQSRLDYAISLLYGTSTTNIHKLQCTQNTLPNCSFKLPMSSSLS